MTLIHRLFEGQAAREPDRIALVFAPEPGAPRIELTYGELNRRAGRLAAHLRGLGVGPEQRVGVSLDRSPDMIVALLAILKAGGAYAPLDPAYPKDRLALMMEDAFAGLASPVLVTREELLPRLPPVPDGVAVVCVGKDLEDGKGGEYEGALAGNLAYLIFTSGSTGRPKAVAIEHRSAVEMILWAQGVYTPAELAGVFAATSINFDLSVFEMFVPLASGGTIILGENALALARTPAAGEVTLINTVPSAIAELLRMGGVPPSARTVNLAGEPLRGALARRIHELGTVERLWNLYGPSEDTTYSTFTEVPPGDGEPTIGRPLPGTRAWVLDAADAALEPVSGEDEGELFLAGLGLARGYLNRPDLTAERFLPDPFAEEGGQRMYRTGDLVRWLPEGDLKYIGRADHQVKIRGYRIEIGEIEAALSSCPGVRDAAVLAREDEPGEKRLVAYVVASVQAGEILDFLRRKVPDPMLPSAFVFLGEMPLNPNGKVDRGALMRIAPSGHRGPLETPRTRVETVLADLWAEALGLEQVGITDDFLESGGHSLLASRILSRVREIFGANLPLGALFEAPTVAALALRIESQAGADPLPPILPVSRESALPLSFAQERLWFLDRLNPDPAVYNMPYTVRLRGELDRSALEHALSEIVRRHEALRTVFQAGAAGAGQIVQPPGPVPVPMIDMDAGLLLERARRPFDLKRDLLLRAELFRLEEHDHVLLLVMHHIASDGWSVEILARELAALYAGSPLPELPVQYAEFAVWQREWLRGEVLEEQVSWWRAALEGAPSLIDLPLDRPRPAVQTFQGARRSLAVPPEIAAGLRSLHRQAGATLFMSLLAVFQGLIYRYTGQRDLLVGAPIANRRRRETENLIGFFVNTLALRGRVREDSSLSTLLRQARTKALGAYTHQDLPFEKLIEELRIERTLGANPLVQAVLAIQDPLETFSLPGLAMSFAELHGGTAPFDLFLALAEEAAGLTGFLEYSTDLFDASTAERWARHFLSLLAAAVAEPDRPIVELPLLDDAERHQLLVEWNDTRPEPSREIAVHLLFEEWAKRTPEAPAVVEESRTWTYGELDRHASRLASRLRSLGVGLESRVAVAMEHSPERIAVLLAVLKAGGAYVSLDPADPPDRREFVLADCGAALLVTGDELLPLEEDSDSDVPDPDRVAYVIYTSGSTGRPKGVEVPHRGLLNLVRWHQRAYAVTPADRATQLAGAGFDASVWELWPYLAAGAAVLIVPQEVRAYPARLVEWMTEERVTLSFLPTALAELALEEPWRASSLRALLVGGDRLHHVPPAGLGFELVNHYGPTESSVVTTATAVRPDEPGAPPIGRPIDGIRTFLLDRAGLPVPIGVAGELYVGGSGLARAYLARPDLTAERFVPDGFANPRGEPGARLYRTGDLARQLPSGQIEFLGRIDNQVKVRGFRIELGEVEAVLRSHPGVREAVVAARPSGTGDVRLVGYVVGRPGLAAPDLAEHLRAELPAFMVPSAFVLLDALPLSASGKVDRRALPDPAAGEPSAEGSDAPRTPTEELLAEIWSELLGLGQVPLDADFFELGGHSLLATRLISRIAAELGVDLPLRAVFNAPTVAGLASRLETVLEQGEGLQVAPIRPVPREGPLPLSFAQERLWLFEQLMPGSSAYEIPVSFRLEGGLDPAVLAASLGEVVRRHEVLRTVFASAAGQPYQVVQPFWPVPLPLIDLQALPPRLGEAEAARWTSAGQLGAFDLGMGPLLRALLLKLGRDMHVLSLSMHHIVSDGWSMGVLTHELGALYSEGSQGRPSPLPELPLQYADFAVWQRGFLGDGTLDRQLAWWQRELEGAPPQLILPYDRPRPMVQSFRAAQRISTIPGETARRLRTLSRKNGSTLFMTLMAAFQALLYRYTGQEDLLVGTPIANRNRSEIEGLIGFFVNTLVLRGRPSAELGFRDLLRQVRSMALGAYARQDLPFERLVEALRVERNLGHNPLFQVLFTLQSTSIGDLELPGIVAAPLRPEVIATPFDVGLSVWDQGGELVGEIEYSTDLFDVATIDRLMGHFRVLLEGIAADPDRTLAELPLLTEAEHRQLAEWNDTRLEPPRVLVPQAFEDRARRAPGAVAVELEGESLTYGELDLRADRLAARLRARGVERETRVGLMMERSLGLVVGLLGIWKAGGAYVPLDPHLPEDRLVFQIEDALLGQEAAVLVARERPRGRLAELPLDVVLLDGDDEKVLEARSEILPGDLAYLIYTSGTTGRPKAVLVEHGNLAQTMQAAQAAFEFEPSDRMPCLAAFTFDIFLLELLGPLLAGGTSVLYPLKPALDVSRLVEDLPGLTRLHGVPALMRQVTESVRRRGLRTGLKHVFVGGDAVPADLLGEMRQAFPDARLTILYGPTEAAIICSRHEVASTGSDVEGRALLGRPLANVHLELRDLSGELVPIGVPGEVWIGGPGVARGYLHRPELTRDRFVFAGGERHYRTGDLASRLPDGTLEFLGRMDQQVKVRGFRIELGEIEAVLAQHPAVRQAAVLALKDGSRLVAYVVGEDDGLRPYLAARLPDYMVPSAIVLLDELPLTPHGKVDRTALARIVPTVAISDADEAPRTPTEELLAGAWSGLLGLARVGIHDNFFEIGGHSLLATRLAFWISTELGVGLPMRAIFEAPTVAALAERIEEERAAGLEQAPPILRVPRDGRDFPLSFAQERLWVLDQLTPGLSAYSIPLALRLSGAVDPEALASALNEIVRRHEVLRTTFEKRGGQPRQVVLPSRPLDWQLVDFREREPDARRWLAEEVSRPFDLSSEPLLRAALLRLGGLGRPGDEEWVLFVNVHHIISDGWSLEVLSRELAALYRAFLQGLPSPLPELPIQYADFVLWQREWLSGPVLQRQTDWWKEQLLGVPDVLELPFDRPRRAVQTFRGSLRLPRWSPALADAVRRLSRTSGATLFMTLAAAFQALLHRLSGQPDLAVGSPIANRTHRDLEELIGLFVNTVVLRARFESGSGEGISFRDLLAQVRTMSLGAHAHQDLPFERLIEELRIQRSLHYNPLFQVMFAFQSSRPEALGLPGVAVERLELETRATAFDLGVSIRERAGGLAGEVEYSTDLFDGVTIDRMMEQLRVLLEGVVADPGRPVAGLPLLSEAELQQLREWNNTRLAPMDATEISVLRAFEEQARRTPDAVAVVFEGESLAYAGLDLRVGRLAARLRARGVERETRVGLMMERSLDLVVGLLGIWKAGGAYVPLDPHLPEDRLVFQIEDALLGQAATVLVARERPRGRLAELPLDVVLPDGGDEKVLEARSEILPGDLAYLIYTSGTTGRPKAVLVEHGNLAQTMLAAQAAFGFEPSDRMPCLAAFTFDIFLLELLGPLLAGGTSVLYPLKPALDVSRLVEDLPGLTRLHGVPALMRQVTESVRRRDLDTGLKQVFVGGDAVPADLLGEMSQAFPDARITILYGPTEAAIICSRHEVAGTGDEVEERALLGRPLANVHLDLRDGSGELVPIGVTGEIWIGGPGVARGYLHQPELTREKFVSLEGERRYRTGDLARRLPDGTLEFLGRIDQQVKVRGFRIELGEIEAVLAQHPAVRQAAVLALKEGGEARLVAYIVGETVGEAVGEADLRSYLASRLPDYMMPSALVLLDELPLTLHGKVDRKALVRIVPAVGLSDTHAAPRTPTEELLAGAWAGLLGLARVGIHDNFFEIGGHSLLATRLAFWISTELGVDLPMRAIFEAPTVAALADRVEDERAAGLAQAPPIRRVPRDASDADADAGGLPLSFAQERLWFLDRLEPDRAFYNMPFALRLTGELHVSALEDAIGGIVRRHEVLRTTFTQAGGMPRQVVSDIWPRLPILDLEGLPPELREPEAERRLIEAGLLPFDLERGPLLRAFLLRLSGQEHALLVALHHIVGDGWSIEVLRAELAALYGGQPLPELPIQYADYAVWQREWLRGEVLEREIAWWKEELAGAQTVLSLPADRLRPAVQTFRGTVLRQGLPPGLMNAVRDVSRRHGATLFMTCLSVFQLLLHRLSAQDDVLVGTPVAGRGRQELQGLIGFFVNTVILRGRFGEPGASFERLLERTRTSTLDTYAHQDLPFEKLVEEMKVERSLSHNPLFQVMFSFENEPAFPSLPGLESDWLPLPIHSTKVDLALGVEERDVAVEYATDLFDRTTIGRMLRHFRALLEGAASEPARPLASLSLLSEAERHQILEWNDTRPERPASLPVHLLFEEQARRTPDAVAVVFEDESLTYRELSRRSDLLAARLRGKGVEKGTRVGLMVERSAGMVAALLGIWKAGGAYVPLDPHQPEARLSLLIEDAIQGQSAQVIVNQEFLDEETWVEDVPGEPVSLRDLAYLIYTSGTTGRPKAVMVEHGNLAQTLRAAQEAFAFEPSDRMPCLAAFTFDIFLLELFGPLLAGGTAVLFPLRPTLDVPRLVASLDELTLLHAVPAVMREVVEGARLKGTGRQLRQLFVGGDAVPSDLLSDMRAVFPEARIHVLYGPTEAAIICSSHEVKATDLGSLLGRPLSGAILELRDRNGHLVPIGVPGEVWIGGEGVARGYLHQPDLTAEKFVTLHGRRWYRSGDLARRLADGTLEFLGRIDHQVKVRGFRIELGEIESVLAQHPGVSQAAVLAVGEGSGKRLAAFVSLDGEVAADTETLRDFLASRLPDYMVPSFFTVLDALPLTPHGKVDRRELERSAPASARDAQEWVPPATPTEVALAAIWSEVLGVERVGLRDGFFELGGHSLMATRLVSRVGTALAVELPLRTVFEAPVLEAMAGRIDALRAAGAGLQVPPIVPVSREGDLPLSFAQERLWFLYQLEPESPLYNILAALRLAGSLDVGALRASLSEIVRRHEVLRTTYAHEGRGVQRIAPPTEILLSVADLRGLREEARDPESLRLVKQEELRSFDLRQGPVARFRLLRLDETRWILLLAIHHIASDGWSTGVLMQELMMLYGGRALPELPVQYGDFAVWQRRLEGEILERLLAYWRQALAGAPARIDLPLDRPRPAAQRYRGATRPLNVPLDLFRKAEDLSRKLGTTLFMTLFACFQVLLHRVTGQDDLLVGTPVAGRNRGETENLIGCFVNTLVLRGRLEPGEREEITFRDLLGRGRAVALDAFMHQDLPFEKLVEDLQVERSLSYNPLFQVLFTLQNAPMEDPRLPGVDISPVEGDSDVSLFDLSLGLGEFRGEVLGGLQYNIDLFDASTVDRWAEHFRLLLEGVVENPDQRLRDLPGLAEPERRQQEDEAPAGEEALQARVAARGNEVAERRSALSEQKRAALEKLLRARRKQS